MIKALFRRSPHTAYQYDIQYEEDDFTPLMSAAATGDIEKIYELVKEKVDLEAEDRNGCTALFWAILGGQERATILLKRAGANPYHKNKEGVSPFILACQKMDQAVVLHLAEGNPKAIKAAKKVRIYSKL